MHQANSDGKIVTGSYRIALADGRTQLVAYKADENGYVADVKYEGEAKYDEIKSTYTEPKSAYPKPAYPKPAYPEPAYPKPAYPEPAYPGPAYPKPAYPPQSFERRVYSEESEAPSEVSVSEALLTPFADEEETSTDVSV